MSAPAAVVDVLTRKEVPLLEAMVKLWLPSTVACKPAFCSVELAENAAFKASFTLLSVRDVPV